MPVSDTSGVKIVINVVDANSGEVVSRVSKNLDQIGTSASNASKKVTQSWNDLGAGASVAGKKSSDAMDQVGSHSLSALDNVRLLRDDLGIRIPRAMESVIARSGAMSGAIAAAGQTFVAIGAAELIFHVGEEVYELYKRWLDTTAAVKGYEVEAGKAAKQKLFEDGSFDRQIQSIQQAKTEISQLSAKKKAYQQQDIVMKGYDILTGGGYKTGDDKHLADAMGRLDEAEVNSLTKAHQLMLQNIDDIEKRKKASATAAGAIAIERQAMRDRNKENLSYAQEMDATLVDQVNRAHKADPEKFHNVAGYNQNAGQEEFLAAEQSADTNKNASSTELAKQQEKELMDLRHQADQAGLEGERLLQAQRVAAIEDLAQKWNYASRQNRQYAAEEDAINKRFDNEEVQRINQQTDALRKRNEEANQRGLTGLAAIDARMKVQNDDVDADLGKHRFFGDKQQQQDYASGLKNANERGAGAESAKAQQDFTDRIKQMDESRANSSMSANARILADTRRTIDELQKAFDQLYGGLGAADPRRVQGQQSLDAEKGRIGQSAQDQIDQNQQQLAIQTRKLQAEAGRGGGGNRYAEQAASIRADEEDRAAEIERQRKQAQREGDLQAEQQYENQLAAIHQIARNKELDLEREQRDKLAGEIKGFLTNPMEALKRQGEDIASKAAADLLMGHLPGKPGTPGSKGGGLFDGGVDSIFRPFRKGKGNGAGAPGGEHHGIAAAIGQQQAVVNATTATINVGSASFNGAGNPSAAMRGIAKGGYVSTGNGGAFNLGGSGSGDDSIGDGEAGSPAYSADMPASAGSFGGAPSVSTDSSMGSENPAQTAQRVYSDVQSGAGQVKQLGQDLGIFNKPGGSDGGVTGIGGGDGDGDGSVPGGMGSVGGGTGESGGGASQLSGAVGGALGVFSAFEGKGGWGGAFSGAVSGAKLGAELGGPIGAAIGAVGGAVLGFIGHGARVQAQQYWFKELLPKAQQDMLGFESGTTDYQSAYDDFTSMESSAKQRTKQMGPGAEDYYNDTIKPRIDGYMQRLTREQKAGRSQFGMTAAQSHNGGYVGGFGSMATSPTEGWLHAERGEFMLNQQAAMSHADVASMMNAGVSRSDIADYLGGGSGPQRAVVGGGGTTELHFHSPDARGAYQLFMDNKHHVRAALNASYAENSGGAD